MSFNKHRRGQHHQLAWCLLIASLAASCLFSWPADSLARTALDTFFEGDAWSTADGETKLLIRKGRITVEQDGTGRNLGILDREDDKLLVLLKCGTQVLTIGSTSNQGEQRLSLSSSGSLGDLGVFERADANSVIVEREKIEIAEAKPLDETEIEAIQQEIQRRMELDQKLYKRQADGDETARRERAEVMEENAEYLLTLLERVGWPDRERFGTKTAFDAAMMVKHSEDLALMSAVLPHIEADFREEHPDSMAFAILVDSTNLALGKPQKYGTQVNEDEQGPMVCLLEDVDRVDEYRQEIGLPPLAEYMKVASQYLYDNREMRILGDPESAISTFEERYAADGPASSGSSLEDENR